MEITGVHCALRTSECFWVGTHHDREGLSTGYRSSLKLNASHETPGSKPLVQQLYTAPDTALLQKYHKVDLFAFH